tara:strand:+ start:4994 stop:5308 length:315 start_codon:yes stop_codon:yes gene_type:complete
MEIRKNETEIIGRLINEEGDIIFDNAAKRVNFLVSNSLKKIKSDEETGWDILYYDIRSDNFWELIYNQSHLHSGGAPSLYIIKNKEDIYIKYDLTKDDLDKIKD